MDNVGDFGQSARVRAFQGRRRWLLPVEVFWWIETAFVVVLIPSPGVAAGLLLSPIFLPVLVSHVRHVRSLGPLGYWYSVAVVEAQCLAVIAGGWTGVNSSRDLIIWIVASLFALWLGVAALRGTPRPAEGTPIAEPGR